VNNSIGTGAYTKTIFNIVFGDLNSSDVFSKAESLCRRLIFARVPMDQKSAARAYVAEVFNRLDCDQTVIWTIAYLLGMDQRHLIRVDSNLVQRLKMRDERIIGAVNSVRSHQQFDQIARWVLGEMIRHVATSTEGLGKEFKRKNRDLATIHSIVKEFSQVHFADVIKRLISAAELENKSWISPGIITEHILCGTLGGGDWFRDEVRRPILLWKERKEPLRKFYIRCNQKFIDICAPKRWPAKACQRVGRPNSKIQRWTKFELMDWLGAAWIEANMDDGFWKDQIRQIGFAIDALYVGGAFILGAGSPSPRGIKYEDQFVSSLLCIRNEASRKFDGADFRLWFDWDWIKGIEPAQFRNCGDLDDTVSEEANQRYEAKLGEAYGYQCELARLARDGDAAAVEAYIKMLARNKIPPYLISDWVKYPTIVAETIPTNMGHFPA
jgi:hypothetical protein